MYPCVNTDIYVTDVYIGVYIRTHTCIFTWKLPIRTIGRSNSSCSARLKIPRYQSTLTFILYVQTIILYVRTQTHEYVCVYVFRYLLYHMYKQPTLLYTYMCQNIYKYIYVCIHICIDVTCITVNTSKHIRTRIKYVHVYVHTFVYVYVCTWPVHSCMYKDTIIYIFVDVYIFVCVCVCVCVCVFVYICVCIYEHVCCHTHTQEHDMLQVENVCVYIYEYVYT